MNSSGAITDLNFSHNKGKIIDKRIKNLSRRELLFYIIYLEARISQDKLGSRIDYQASEDDRLREHLRDKLLACCENNVFWMMKHVQSTADLEHLIRQLNQLYHHNINSDDTFDWLKEDKAACYHLWCLLAINERIDRDIFSPFQTDYKSFPAQFFTFTKGSNHQSRLDEIISFFDHLKFSSLSIYLEKINNNNPSIMDTLSPVLAKTQYLQNRRNQWETYKQNKDNLAWLKEEDSEQCKWAWEYLEKQPVFPEQNLTQQCQKSLYLLIQNVIKKNYPEKEPYLAVYTAINAWNVDQIYKTALVRYMKNAWSQNKFRSKNKKQNNLPLNTYLKKEVKKQLEALASEDGRNLKDVLETLIIQEVKRRKKDKTS